MPRTEELLGEVLREGDRLLLARGGRGGRGNAAFLSNRNRAPREAEPGEPGEERWLRLDLKLHRGRRPARLPNAGKSTLLSPRSRRRARRSPTTRSRRSRPVLGVVDGATTATS